MFDMEEPRPPLEREAEYGFRCVKYVSEVPRVLFETVVPELRDSTLETPMSNEQFQLVMGYYGYERGPLNVQTVRVEEHESCKYEVVSFDAAYRNERIVAHVFLPHSVKPPYQTIIYAPGRDAFERIDFPSEPFRLGIILTLTDSGRAVIWPVYQDTYERAATVRHRNGPNDHFEIL